MSALISDDGLLQSTYEAHTASAYYHTYNYSRQYRTVLVLYRVSILIQDTKEMYRLHIYSIVKAQIFTALFPAIPNLGSSARTKRRQSGPQPWAHLSTLLFFPGVSRKAARKRGTIYANLAPKNGRSEEIWGFSWEDQGRSRRNLKGCQVWPSVPLGRGGHIYELNSIKLLNVLNWKCELLIRTLEGDRGQLNECCSI